jgi:multimeric flavodoxin WrbA
MINKKRALIFFGSPKEDSFTSRLLESFVLKIEKYYIFDIVKAYDQNIKPCIGCGNCNDKFTCIYDDFKNIMHLINESECIIVASPIYNLTFPAPLKLIFDRMQPYFMSRFRRHDAQINEKQKKGIALFTCGGKETNTLLIKKQLRLIFQTINTDFVGTALWDNTDRNKYFKISDDLISNLNNLAGRVLCQKKFLY